MDIANRPTLSLVLLVMFVLSSLLYSAYYEASILTCSHYFPEVLTFPDSHLKGSMVYLQDIASADLLVEV